jgi:hypothetical protein
MTADNRKLLFALDVEDGWPPIASEGVWCDLVGSYFRLRNAPFFIKGLAVNDLFFAEPDPINGHIFEFQIIKPSENSLIWLMNNRGQTIDAFLDRFRSLGCSTEGLEQFALYSIDVPGTVLDQPLSELIAQADGCGLDLAFPVLRHKA